MVNVVRRTGHSSYYVEKGMSAMGKTAKQMGIQGECRINGGAFPIWLENAPCCPIAIAACYSGSSYDDHHLVSTTIRDYLNKMRRDNGTGEPSIPIPNVPMGSGRGANSEYYQESEYIPRYPDAEQPEDH
ncbi:hypothetical protein AX17_001369 [Amanita inopinata Kibby_2008]|nr:hypothetical protein AX17_001369 [Amanita inopinata Kibby_2008]